MFKVELREAGQWWQIETCISLAIALQVASLYCRHHHEESLRIINPKGKVIEL